MSDGMSEAYGKRAVRKKINKNVYIDVDLGSKAVRIVNKLDDHNEVEIKITTLRKIVDAIGDVLDDHR